MAATSPPGLVLILHLLAVETAMLQAPVSGEASWRISYPRIKRMRNIGLAKG